MDKRHEDTRKSKIEASRRKLETFSKKRQKAASRSTDPVADSLPSASASASAMEHSPKKLVENQPMSESGDNLPYEKTPETTRDRNHMGIEDTDCPADTVADILSYCQQVEPLQQQLVEKDKMIIELTKQVEAHNIYRQNTGDIVNEFNRMKEQTTEFFNMQKLKNETAAKGLAASQSKVLCCEELLKHKEDTISELTENIKVLNEQNVASPTKVLCEDMAVMTESSWGTSSSSSVSSHVQTELTDFSPSSSIPLHASTIGRTNQSTAADPENPSLMDLERILQPSDVASANSSEIGSSSQSVVSANARFSQLKSLHNITKLLQGSLCARYPCSSTIPPSNANGPQNLPNESSSEIRNSIEVAMAADLSQGFSGLESYLRLELTSLRADLENSMAMAQNDPKAKEDLKVQQQVFKNVEQQIQELSVEEGSLWSGESRANCFSVTSDDFITNEALSSTSLVSFSELDSGSASALNGHPLGGNTMLYTINEESSAQDNLVPEKFEDYLVNLKTSHNNEKTKLEQEIESLKLKTMENANAEVKEKYCKEKEELLMKITTANAKVAELEERVVNSDCLRLNQIADLVDEHNQDMEDLNKLLEERRKKNQKLEEDINKMNSDHSETLEKMEREKIDIIESEKQAMALQHEAEIEDLTKEHETAVRSVRSKIECLMQEKCELDDNRAALENTMKRSQIALNNFCNGLQLKVIEASSEISAVHTTDSSLKTLLQGFLNNINWTVNEGQTLFRSEHSSNKAVGDAYFPLDRLLADEQKIQKSFHDLVKELNEKHKVEIDKFLKQHERNLEQAQALASELDSEQIRQIIDNEINRAKEEWDRNLELQNQQNEKITNECHRLSQKIPLLESENLKLREHLKRAGQASEERIAELQNNSLSVETNSRLLRVLSDLVRASIDTEHEINAKLEVFGLRSVCSYGLNADDDTVQSVGSREDFTSIPVGELPNLDLTEDGPDLTPRTWDLINIGSSYDAEKEGEDVVISASRRLRSAVDFVLQLLSFVFDKQQDSVKKHNDSLQEESEDKDIVHSDLFSAGSMIRKCQMEHQKMQEEVIQLNQDRELINRLLDSMKLKVSELEEEKEIACDEKKYLKEQLYVLSNRLMDPDKKLLEENTRLSAEKLSLDRNLIKERRNLNVRIQQLGMELEEVNALKEEIIEKHHKEVEDLNAQIEAVDKQLQSSRKFIDEQVSEREQEREDYNKKARRLSDAMKEKDKIQILCQQQTKEAEELECQLNDRIDKQKKLIAKIEKLERELKQANDRTHDQKDIIVELEEQLKIKGNLITGLEEKMNNVKMSFVAQEKHVFDLKSKLNEMKQTAISKDSTDQLQDLEEQLLAKNQELQQMSQSDILLKELRGQIHFLEAKVDQKVKQLETMHFTSSISCVPNDDISLSDAEMQHGHCTDSWDISPRSVHWLEIQRLEENINRLTSLEEDVVNKNNLVNDQLTKIQAEQEELVQENITLQEKTTDQLLQISAMKAFIDEQKYKTTPKPTISNTEYECLKEQLKENETAYVLLQQKCEFLENEKGTLVRESRSRAESIEELKDYIQQHKLSPNASNALNTTEVNQESLLIEKEGEIQKLNGQVERSKILMDRIESKNSKLAQRILELQEKNTDSEKQIQLQKEKLEEDMKTVFHIVEEQRCELDAYQVEAENQIRLEEEVKSLKESLDRSLQTAELLKAKIIGLKAELDGEKRANEKSAAEYQEKETTFSEERNLLKNKISVLKQNLRKNDDGDLVEICNKIMEAVLAMKKDSEDKQLLQEIVLSILSQAIETRMACCKMENDKVLADANIAWQNRLELEKNMLKTSLEEEFQKHLLRLKKEHAKNIETVADNCKQELKNRLELADIENARNLQTAEHKVEELPKLQEQINKLTNDKAKMYEKYKQKLKSNIDALKIRQEKEKDILTKNFEDKFMDATEKIEQEFLQQKENMKTSYKEQIRDLSLSYEKQIEDLKSYNSKLEVERAELQNTLQTVETKHEEELKKLELSHMKTMAEINKDIISLYDTKVGELREYYDKQISDFRSTNFVKQKSELEELERRLKTEFKEQKNSLLKDNDTLAEETQQKIAECDQKWKEKYSALLKKVEKSFLKDVAKKVQVNSEYQAKLHQEEIEKLKKQHVFEMMKVNGMWKALKDLTARHSNQSSRCHSEANLSSDDTCSSCRDYILPENRKLLFEKIQKDCDDIAAFVELRLKNNLQSDRKIRSLQEERIFVLNRLESLVPAEFQTPDNESLEIAIENVSRYLDYLKKLTDNWNKERKTFLHRYNQLSSKCKAVEYNLQEEKKEREKIEDDLAASRLQLHELRNLEQDEKLRKSIENHSVEFGDVSVMSIPERARFSAERRSSGSLSFQLPTVPSMSHTKSSETYQFTNGRLEKERPQAINYDPTTAKVLYHSNSPVLAKANTKNESRYKTTLVRVISPVQDPETGASRETSNSKVQSLYWKYKRSQSYLKAMLFQKKYLVNQLRGFQSSEAVTEAILIYLNMSLSSSNDPFLRGYLQTYQKKRPKFRSVVVVVIAISRMKSIVAKWRKEIVVPPSVIENGSPYRSRTQPELQRHSESNRSLDGAMDNRHDPDNGEGSEQYVSRLKLIQRQLGLDDV